MQEGTGSARLTADKASTARTGLSSGRAFSSSRSQSPEKISAKRGPASPGGALELLVSSRSLVA